MTERVARRVVLIGWSAADWKVLNPLLDAGRMPVLQSLVERGVKGDLSSLSPMVEPQLWTSVITGHTADGHGILGPFELDDATGATHIATSTSRRKKALWNLLAQSGLRTVAVNWFASQPAEKIPGAIVSNLYPVARAAYGQPWALPAGAIHPRAHRDALAELRVHAGDFTGDDLVAFLPGLAQVDQRTDKRPLSLAISLAESVSVHGAATWLMENEDWDLLVVHFSSLMAVNQTFMPYHPPRRENVTEGDFAIYGEAVSRVYGYHDAMLGRLVELAGPDAAIVLVSAHGFQTGALRPADGGTVDDRSHGWERGHGVFVAAGPGIRKDELVFGAGLLDIAPFVLRLFGLPAGEDMPGRVMAEAFERPPVEERIPTWEDAAAPEVEEDWDRAGALAELAALGYKDRPLPAQAEERARVAIHNEGTLAHVHMAAGRFAEALPLLRNLVGKAPGPASRLALAHCLHMLRQPVEARRLVEQVQAEQPERSHAWLLGADLALASGDRERAFELLREAGKRGAENAQLQYRAGLIYEKAGQWVEAEACHARAIALDEQMQPAYTGRARALLEADRNPEAAHAALHAVNLRYDDHSAHYLLGAALARDGRVARAMQALQTSIRYQPTASAHRLLALLHEKAMGDPLRARQHSQRAGELEQPE